MLVLPSRINVYFWLAFHTSAFISNFSEKAFLLTSLYCAPNQKFLATALAQEHNTMSPARAQTRTARSGVEPTNHETTAPPTVCGKMLGYLSAGIYLFREANSFSRAQLEENCELRGTDNLQGQIFDHTFASNAAYCVYYPSKICGNNRGFETWGITQDIFQF